MALRTFSVHVEKPAASLADTMNSIRSWLDSHRIEPVEFRSHSSNDGAMAFEIAFQSEGEAHLFERNFRIPGSTEHTAPSGGAPR